MDANEPLHEPVHEENEVLSEVWLPLHEAAAALKISPRAVQLRAEKGTTKRDRRDGRVVFAVSVPKPVHEESECLHEENEVVHEVAATPNTVYVAHLEAEVQFLRAQIETHQQNEAELRRLMLADKRELSELREQMKLLAATPVEDASQDSQEKHTATQETDTENHPLEPQKGAQSQAGGWRSWWDRVRGK